MAKIISFLSDIVNHIQNLFLPQPVLKPIPVKVYSQPKRHLRDEVEY